MFWPLYEKQTWAELKKIQAWVMEKFSSEFLLLYLHLRGMLDFWNTSLSFVRFNLGRITDKLAINWQNFYSFKFDFSSSVPLEYGG